MKRILIVIVAFVVMVTQYAAAQATINFYCEDYDAEAKVMMFPTGITVSYNGRTYSLAPVNVLPQGMAYSNGAGVSALIPITCQNMTFCIGNSCIEFVAIGMSAAPGGSVPQYGGYSNGSSGSSGSVVGTKQCSLCHGKGWIAGTSTPTYGSGGTHYCYECGREVYASHSHDRCPSCSGKGTIPTIR